MVVKPDVIKKVHKLNGKLDQAKEKASNIKNGTKRREVVGGLFEVQDGLRKVERKLHDDDQNKANHTKMYGRFF